MDNSPSTLQKLFSVFAKPQTYLNLVYLFLTFPLGLTYFIILITGLSVGFGLIIIWVGLLILAAVFAISWACVHFERLLAVHLLDVSIPQPAPISVAGEPVFQQIKRHFTNPVTWKGIAYLFLKFPLGIATFVVCVTLLSLSFALLMAPFFYPFWHFNFFYTRIDNLPVALVAMIVGVFLIPLSLHLLNLLAELWAKLTVVFLGSGEENAPKPISQTV
ncbi:MAG TPA: sensor domain-containing protein [Leptolinea sp.]